MSQTSLFDQLNVGYKHLGEDLAWLPDEPWPRLMRPHQDDHSDRESNEQEVLPSPDDMPFPALQADDASTVANVVSISETDSTAVDTSRLAASEDETIVLADAPVTLKDFEDHTISVSDRKTGLLMWRVWIRRILIVLIVMLVASVVTALIPSVVRQARMARIEQHLDTSISALRTADSKAQTVFDGLERDELDDAKLYERLSARIEANKSLLLFKQDSLDIDGLDAMSVKIDKAAVSTRKLTVKVSHSLQAKTLAIARNAAEEVLQQAKNKLESTESNETTETVLKDLRKVINQTSKLDDKSKASDWTKASERLSEAMNKVDAAVTAKQQGDEQARQQAEAEQQEHSQQEQSNSESYQPAPQQQYQSAPSQSPQSSNSSSSDGWSVPAPDSGSNLPGTDSSL